MYKRRIRDGWPEDLAANEPAMARRPSGMITVDGARRVPLVEILRQSGVGLWTYHSRRRLGWSAVRAATTPPRRGRPDSKTEQLYSYRGESMSLVEETKKSTIERSCSG